MATIFTGNDYNGVSLTNDNEDWETAEGDVVAGTFTGFDFNAVQNASYTLHGYLFAELFDGIAADAGSSNLSILIGTTGLVHGAFQGIDLDGSGHDIVNNGTIVGSTFGAVGIHGDDILLTNNGVIQGAQDGVVVDILDTEKARVINTGFITGADSAINVRGGNNTLVNSGLLSSEIGIDIDTSAGERTKITNTGTIASTDVGSGTSPYFLAKAIHASGGNEIIVNNGQISGSIVLGSGNDKYVGKNGSVDGEVHGEDGRDQLTGGASDDVFYGGEGRDVLSGLGGDDVLNGGRGVDQLTGGGGEDVFVFGADSGSDIVFDFAQGTDMIDLIDLEVDFAAVRAVTTVEGDSTFINLNQLGGLGRVEFRDFTDGFTSADFVLDEIA